MVDTIILTSDWLMQVDSHETLANGVVVQVSGELSNNGEPMRRFMQTFVLAPQSPKKYYVHNDIFRYQVRGRLRRRRRKEREWKVETVEKVNPKQN